MNLKINDRIQIRDISEFSDFRIVLKHNSVASTFSFFFHFDPNNKDHAELACVSHYHEAILEHDGERIITGYIVSNGFASGPKKELTQMAGYSKAGILEDCDIPPDLYPLETNGLNLKQIAERLIKKFGLKLRIEKDAYTQSTQSFINTSDPDVDENGRMAEEVAKAVDSVTPKYSLTERVEKAIKKSNGDYSQNIKAYLTSLATQRNILIGHDRYGDLTFTEPKSNSKPIAHFESGVIGTDLRLTFDGQSLHSHIYVLLQADEDGKVTEPFILRNPLVPTLYRPKVVSMSSGDAVSMQDFAQQELARELRGIKLTITIDRWQIDGKIVFTDNTVTVKDKELFLYKTTTWFIDEVALSGTVNSQVATLTCVMPEVYNGKVPKNIFVDAHKNFPRE